MEDNISFVETEKIDENVQIILRQTDYTEEIAKEKLKEFNYDHMAVIRAYFGIPEKKVQPIKSVNQEIYKQLRYKLDSNMRNYQERVEKGEAKKI
jgi:hypothetical protein